MLGGFGAASYDRSVSMLALEGWAQSSRWKLTRTGDTGDCRIMGDCDGTPGNGFTLSFQSNSSTGAMFGSGRGFRRGGLLAVEGGEAGGEVVMAAIAGEGSGGELLLSLRPSLSQ